MTHYRKGWQSYTTSATSLSLGIILFDHSKRYHTVNVIILTECQIALNNVLNLCKIVIIWLMLSAMVWIIFIWVYCISWLKPTFQVHCALLKKM
jgi:hypothetical protein